MEKLVKHKLYIGIDVHKRQWSVCIFTANIHHKSFSQAPQPAVLKAYIDKHFRRIIRSIVPMKLANLATGYKGS